MSTEKTKITFEMLTKTVQSAVAIRYCARLQPAGGPGTKVFPPTYEGGKYATEDRVINGQRIPCVILDSVPSQANRMELALLQAARAKKIDLPIVEVDFVKQELPEVGVISSLEAPHRIADAILRDSMLKGVKFRETEDGKAFTNATMNDATALFRLCPTALLFGMWDSTGPKGGVGTKFQRAIVGEVIGVNAVPGVKTSSRIDPLGIQRDAGPLYETPDRGWTLNADEARKEKGKAKPLGKDGKPSEANHGNIMPALEIDHGGVTIDYAICSIVLSLPALRRLRFPKNGGAYADKAAQNVLAALGICAATLAIEQGCDLRSRCLLVPEGSSSWELVNADGTVAPFAATGAAACDLLKTAVTAAKEAGLPWMENPLTLTPSPSLVKLVKKSRELAMKLGAKSEG